MKALLNDEGKRIWGFAFPDGEIPVTGPGPSIAKVDGNAGPLENGTMFPAYMVAWDQLNTLQKTKILEYFKERFGGSPEDVLRQIEHDGLPLRAALVSSVMIEGRFF